MGETTGIDWTDRTWNPWQGCHPIAHGCAHCYMHRDKRRYGQDPGTVVRSKPPTFNQPVSRKWQEPAKVFVCSWSDFFIEEADAWRPEAWDIMRRAPHLTYQIPTKRPGRIAECLPPDWGDGWPNVWLGASVSNQDDMKRVWPELRETPAAVRFLSCEPLLGPITLLDITRHQLQWVIAGCESGPHRRETADDWIRYLRDQCVAAAVPFFLKQQVDHNNKLAKMPELDGRVWDQMPERLENEES